MSLYPIPITEAYSFIDEKSVTAAGDETVLLSAADKEQILSAWQQFMLNGFKNLFFRADLYRFLIHHCHFSAHRNRDSSGGLFSVQIWNVSRHFWPNLALTDAALNRAITCGSMAGQPI